MKIAFTFIEQDITMGMEDVEMNIVPRIGETVDFGLWVGEPIARHNEITLNGLFVVTDVNHTMRLNPESSANKWKHIISVYLARKEE